MRALLLAALCLLVACGEGTAPEDTEAATPDGADAPTESATPPPRPPDQTLTIDLQMEGLSPLYKGFFSDPPLKEQLARDLGPHVDSRSATIKVVWDEETVTGTISMLVPDGEALLAATGKTFSDSEILDPAPLDAYLRGIEGYRTSVGERYDLRVLSFGLTLELWDPHTECRCLWGAVTGADDDAELGPSLVCHDPFGKVLELNRDGDVWPAPIKGNKKARKALKGALGG